MKIKEAIEIIEGLDKVATLRDDLEAVARGLLVAQGDRDGHYNSGRVGALMADLLDERGLWFLRRAAEDIAYKVSQELANG